MTDILRYFGIFGGYFRQATAPNFTSAEAANLHVLRLLQAWTAEQSQGGAAAELAALDRQVSEIMKAQNAAMQQRDIPTMRAKMAERQQVTQQRAAKQKEVAAAAVVAAVAQVHAKDAELEKGWLDPAAIAQETAQLEAALIPN